MNQPYHKYVFDQKARKFIGKFEEMYKHEDKVGYDSWHLEDITHLGKRLALAILNRYNFETILDIGCGKGTFTNLLKRANNKVYGVDISKTAIRKAQIKYPDITFEVAKATDILTEFHNMKYDLVVMIEVLSYVSQWQCIIRNLAWKSRYIFVSVHLPPNTIGFVKNFSDLVETIEMEHKIMEKVLWNDNTLLILAKSNLFSSMALPGSITRVG